MIGLCQEWTIETQSYRLVQTKDTVEYPLDLRRSTLCHQASLELKVPGSNYFQICKRANQ